MLESSGPGPIGTFQEESDRLNALIDGKPVPSSDNGEAAAAELKVETDSSLLGLETSASKQQSPKAIKLGTGKDDAEPVGVRITELAPSYGFNNAYSDFFRVWHGEVSEILSLPDPEHMQPEQRRTLREAAEEAQFDIERYLMDFANQGDDMYFELTMAYEPFWRKYPVLPQPAVTAPKKITEVKVTKPLIVEVDSTLTVLETVSAACRSKLLLLLHRHHLSRPYSISVGVSDYIHGFGARTAAPTAAKGVFASGRKSRGKASDWWSGGYPHWLCVRAAHYPG